MEDGAKDTRTGLKVKVIANFHVPGDYDHRKGHLRSVNTEYARLLGAALSNPSERVTGMAMGIVESTLRHAVRIARMDEDEIQVIADEVARVLEEALKKIQHMEPPQGFSTN